MKIIHLSDLHIGKDFKRKNIKKFKIALRHALSIKFDHLVITGDLSESAHESEFRVIRKILKDFDLLDSSKVSIVIGNHDIFGGVQIAADVLDFPRKCKSADYDVQVSNFISHFEELFTDCQFASPNKFFPYYKNLGDIGIIGINSIARYSKIGNPLASTGKVYPEQLDDIRNLISENNIKDQLKIALIHHHLYKKNITATSPQNSVWHKIESYTLRLRNKKKLLNVFKACGINVVMHGHSHEVKEYNRKGIYFINAGGSIENDSDNLFFFLIEYKTEDFNVSLENVPMKMNLIHQPTI